MDSHLCLLALILISQVILVFIYLLYWCNHTNTTNTIAGCIIKAIGIMSPCTTNTIMNMYVFYFDFPSLLAVNE